FPPPGIDFQLHSRKRLRLRIFRYAALFAISAELSAHEVFFIDGSYGLEYLYFFIAHRLAVKANRRLHGEVRQDLKHVVLHNVANSAGLVVEGSAALHSEVLCHRDFYALNVRAIPEGFHERVGKTKGQNIVHSPLSEVMIDSEDVFLVENPQQE